MKLELCTFFIKDIVFSDRTKLENGILSVNREELRALLKEDEKFEDVQLHIVHPEERTRLIHILDIVEPRIKVSGNGNVFPGFLGPPHSVGEGRTHRLAGVAVIETSEPVLGESTYWREAILDVGGPGAKYTSFSHTINLVLNFIPRKELQKNYRDVAIQDVHRGTPEALEYNESVRVAGFKAASYLAEVSKSHEPNEVEIYELSKVSDSLPKVVYFCQETWSYIYADSPSVRFGESLQSSLPTLIHPNEFMDGAVTNARTGLCSIRDTTYVYQNYPVIKELFRRHGQDLNFAGVVIYRPGGSKMEEKERISSYAAKLGQLLGAQGAILSWIGGGHFVIDVMLLCQKLEKMSISTVIIFPEMAKNPYEGGMVYFVPEANAIVSVGNYEEEIHLPPVERVIGGSTILGTDFDAAGEIIIPLRSMLCVTNRFGFEKLTARES